MDPVVGVINVLARIDTQHQVQLLGGLELPNAWRANPHTLGSNLSGQFLGAVAVGLDELGPDFVSPQVVVQPKLLAEFRLHRRTHPRVALKDHKRLEPFVIAESLVLRPLAVTATHLEEARSPEVIVGQPVDVAENVVPQAARSKRAPLKDIWVLVRLARIEHNPRSVPIALKYLSHLALFKGNLNIAHTDSFSLSWGDELSRQATEQ